MNIFIYLIIVIISLFTVKDLKQRELSLFAQLSLY